MIDLRGFGAKREVKVHYQGWKARFEEWIPIGGGRLRDEGQRAEEAVAARDDALCRAAAAQANAETYDYQGSEGPSQPSPTPPVASSRAYSASAAPSIAPPAARTAASDTSKRTGHRTPWQPPTTPPQPTRAVPPPAPPTQAAARSGAPSHAMSAVPSATGAPSTATAGSKGGGKGGGKGADQPPGGSGRLFAGALPLVALDCPRRLRLASLECLRLPSVLCD